MNMAVGKMKKRIFFLLTKPHTEEWGFVDSLAAFCISEFISVLNASFLLRKELHTGFGMLRAKEH
jgi:hypothetical protein